MANASREWGDGGNKDRAHEIEVVSYKMGVIVCAIDGEVIRFGPVPSDVAWDLHRGVQYAAADRTAARALLATDDEVAEFIRRLDTGDDTPTLVAPSSGFATAAVPDYDDETVVNFLDKVRGLQARCTCNTNSSILECPNYVDGDELEYE